MYISEVIERAKVLHPTEYTAKEYVHWCDELSSDIRRNYDIRYASLRESTSSVLLPENVSINDISKIIMDGRELKKTDLRDFGLEYEYPPDGKIVRKSDGTVSDFEIIYQVPHTPIRYIDGDYQISFSGSAFVSANIPLLPGDDIVVTVNGAEYKVSINTKEADRYTYSGDTVPDFSGTVHVLRHIPDKTLLPAPYDTAYIDFVNAKASLYQGDEDAYTSFMTQYNTKISDYRTWLTRNMPRAEAKFINWF